MRLHLSHDDACAILAESGIAIPAIPTGCNTYKNYVTLASGEKAIFVIQSGCAPIAGDNEREVNGAMLMVLADAAWSEKDARKILEITLARVCA